MLNKLLANLPFNPSLIGQVSFYANRLKQETSIRRLGFLFMALALAVQIFAVVAPPQPSLASSSNDMISGGFSTHQEAVESCDANREQFADIVNHFGVTCEDIANGEERRIDYSEFDGQLRSVGRDAYGFDSEQEEVIDGVGTLYSRPLTAWGAHCYNDGKGCLGVVGNSKNGAFMILFACGNIAYIPYAPIAPPPPPPPAPTPAKAIACATLLISVKPGSKVPIDSIIALRGHALGQNVPPGQQVQFNYDYIDVATGNVVASASGPLVAFQGSGNSVAIDAHDQVFKMRKAGHYQFRLAVTYDGGQQATGNQVGECTRDIYVNTPPEKCPYNPNLNKNDPNCKPCDKEDNPKDTAACIILRKTARNDTQGIANADGTVANAGDTITYTLSAENTSKTTLKKFIVEENIGDILEYADVIDYHGGVAGNHNTVRWPETDIKAGETISKELTVKVKNPIPQTPASASNPDSFDMTMTNVYGNTVNIKLPPSIAKRAEQVTTSLPNTGPGTNLMIGFVVTAIVGYFFARSRLLAKELTIVRTEYGAGAS